MRGAFLRISSVALMAGVSDKVPFADVNQNVQVLRWAGARIARWLSGVSGVT